MSIANWIGLTGARLESPQDAQTYANQWSGGLPFYGNFCGPGNKLGVVSPVDDLDALCQAHDEGLLNFWDMDDKSLEADDKFVKDVNTLQKSMDIFSSKYAKAEFMKTVIDGLSGMKRWARFTHPDLVRGGTQPSNEGNDRSIYKYGKAIVKTFKKRRHRKKKRKTWRKKAKAHRKSQ